MAEALEVFAIIYVLDGLATLLSTISIGALAVFIKGERFSSQVVWGLKRPERPALERLWL